jgi:hypothetical protein
MVSTDKEKSNGLAFKAGQDFRLDLKYLDTFSKSGCSHGISN